MPMIADISPQVRRVVSWLLMVVSCVGFVTLGLAETNVKGAVISPVPDAPLPFSRHKVVGLDLRGYSSLEAVQWLQAGGVEPYALAIVPVDADIVAALTQPDARPAAVAAMDQMVESAQGVPLAACLWKPPETVGGLGVAQAAAEALVERYPGAIAYVLACGDSGEASSWHTDISRAVRGEDRAPLPGDALIPISAGAPLTLFELPDPDVLTTAAVLAELPSTDRYSGAIVRTTRPPDAEFGITAKDLMSDLAALSLVIARPERQVDPVALGAALGGLTLDGAPLPEGFTSVTAPGIATQGDWILSTVGTVPYARTTTDAAIALEFVGTNLFVQALTSPDGGRLLAWIDPPAGDESLAPDVVVDLNDLQAEDTTIQLASGLPAARHRLVLSADNDEARSQSISISGFIVTGHATPEPVARLAALVFLALATAALTERALASVNAIREREQQRPRRQSSGHPRVFSR
ncbi:MAG TPA: hypothetical protein PKA95_13530 [Thermomicrobiales bacterium]|nr:hypothetical protein [Thermomicrobiales bacterium]